MANAAGIRAGKAYFEVGTYINPFLKGMQTVEKRLKSLGTNFTAIGKKITAGGAGLIAAGSALGAPLLAAAVSFSNFGSQLDDMSQRTGASVETLSELSYAFKQSGLDSETLEASLKKMNKGIGDLANGEKGAVDSFNALGLSMSDLKGKSPDQQFELIISKLGSLKSITEQTTAVNAIFGKSGADLIPLIGNIEELRQKARDLGLVMSTEDAQAAAALGDAMDNVGAASQSLINKIGAALAPTLIDLADKTMKYAKAAGDWIAKNRGLIVTVGAVAVGIVAVGGAVLGLGAAFTVAGTAMTGTLAVLGAIGTVLSAILSPVGLVVTAIAGIGYVIVTQTDVGKAAFSSLADSVSGIVTPIRAAFGGIMDAISAGDLALAGEIAMQGFNVAWLKGTGELQSLWSTTMTYIEGAMDATGMALTHTWSGLEIAWALITTGIEGGWDTLSTNLKAVWAEVIASLTGSIDIFLTKMLDALAEIGFQAKELQIFVTPTFGKAGAYKNIQDQREAYQAKSKEEADQRAAERQKGIDTAGDAAGLEARRQERTKRVAASGDTSKADAEYAKRKTDRQTRLDTPAVNVELQDAETKLAALIDQASKVASLTIDPKKLDRAKAGSDAAQAVAMDVKGVAAAGFGSAAAASSIARNANGRNSFESELLKKTDRQIELTKEILKATGRPLVTVIEHN